MVQINFAQKTVSVKIVYYGPGMSGKTTNLEVVHQRSPESNRGDLTSIATDGDRTLFFDFMPLDLGTVAGMRTQFQIYTVPGQVYYNSTRKLVLQGVDGVIFVADSSASMLEENLESLRNLEENLAEYGKAMGEVPYVIQYNKRDLPDAMTLAELEQHLNPHGVPSFEAVANTGQGVFPTLKALAAVVLDSIHKRQSTGGAVAAEAPAASVPPSLASTGFYQPVSTTPSPAPPPPIAETPAPAPAPQPAPAPAPAPAPPAFAAPQHDPYAVAASADPGPQGQAAPPEPTAQPQGIPTGFPQPGSYPNGQGVDELSKTQVHAPPTIQMQPQQQQPQQQPEPSTLRLQSQPMAEVQHQQPVHQQPMHQQPMHQQPMQQQPMQQAPAHQPQMHQQPPMQPQPMQQPQVYSTATQAPPQPQQAPPQPHVMQVQNSTPAPPPPSASNPVMPGGQGGRLKPRSRAQATPKGHAGRKNAMATGILIAVALAAGVLLGNYVFRLF